MGTAPFSVATERLTTIATGVQITIRVAHHNSLEQIVKRLRDDLRTLGDFAGPSPSPSIMRGIRVAWHHVTALISLPCRPSQFDRFAGLPPVAARATRTFELEIAAWARTLSGDLREIAELVSSDLADLREAFEGANPFERELSTFVADGETLVIVRTQTAGRAFIDSVNGDPEMAARVMSMRRLHREGTWPRVVVVGTPARWEWHQLDSGLSSDVHILVLGDLDAYIARAALDAVHSARARWGSPKNRARVWRELTGEEAPKEPSDSRVRVNVRVVDALDTQPEIDPFEAFLPLLSSTPLVVDPEGEEDSVAQESDLGDWYGEVEAVEILTDVGGFLLPRHRLVDTRSGDEIVECTAGSLQPGMILIVDRRRGRLGLLEALADRLVLQRTDLFAAKLLITDLRASVRRSFAASGITRSDLFDLLCSVGFEKSYQAARGYVDEEGPLAPRDFVDLKRLNEVLDLGMNDQRLRETFAGVQRWRTFRRAAGRALVAASRGSLMATDAARIDRETGLSPADLRDLVLEATILEVKQCEGTVPIAEVGYLRRN